MQRDLMRSLLGLGCWPRLERRGEEKRGREREKESGMSQSDGRQAEDISVPNCVQAAKLEDETVSSALPGCFRVGMATGAVKSYNRHGCIICHYSICVCMCV